MRSENLKRVRKMYVETMQMGQQLQSRKSELEKNEVVQEYLRILEDLKTLEEHPYGNRTYDEFIDALSS